MKFIYSHGGIYKCYNSNLLYHGCIPMTKDGAFDTIMIGGNGYKGKSLMDFLNRQYIMPTSFRTVQMEKKKHWI